MLFDESVTPSMPGRRPHANNVVKRWIAEIYHDAKARR